MEIIFQSGEFINETNSFWSNLINIIAALLGALISGLIAIYIFKKGLKYEVEQEQTSERVANAELEEYFLYNIQSINFFIDKQIEEIVKCSQNIKDWNKKNFTLLIFPELTTKNIWGLNQEKIYKMFISNKVGDTNIKAIDFINVRNCLYNIDDFIRKENELNKEIYQRYYSNIEIWNQSLKTLMKLNNSFVISYNSLTNKENDDFLKLYSGLMVNKQRELIKEGKHVNMKIIIDTLIVPLKEYLKNNPQSSDIRLSMISEPMMNLEKAFIDITNLRKERRTSVLNAGRRLLHIKQIMNKSVSNHKNRKIKS